MSHQSSPPVQRTDQAATQPAPRTTTARFAHSRAVVIGIDRYQHIRPLSTAVSDATRLAEFLRTHHGYDDVLLLENATRTVLATELGEQLAERVGSGDRLLLYFAGHGIALDGDEGPEGFLIPADAQETDRSSFVAMADLYGWLEALPCRHLLVILDCCFAGAFTWYGRRSVRPLGAKLFREHYDRFVREPAWQILTSAAHDQEALDVLGGKAIGVRGEQTGSGTRHSPFADALFAALQGEGDLIPRGQGDGVVTATELYLYLRQTVEVSAQDQAHHRQTPELWPFSRTRHGKGEFIFLVPGRGEPVLEPAPELTAANNPYRGLQSYDEKHAALFFGRSALIERLAAAVDEHPLTVVLGASGTGKSSIVKAGVVPYLKQRRDAAARDEATAPPGNLPDYVTLPPMRPGDAPLRVAAELVAANLLASTAPPAGADPAAFLTDAVRGWLAAHPAQRLLLVVDQVEELITLCRDDAVRDAFLQTLAGLLAAHPDRLRVILTLRTDFEPQFFDSPLNGLWKHGRFVTPPMSQAELREVIEEPAAVRVLFFDPPALVDTLIDEVIQTPGALPLLSFTLEQLYLKYIDRQSQAQHDAVTLERSLLRADYDALGGVIGSLRRRADELYLGLPDDAHRATMQRVMLRMVAVEGGELARRRVMRAELDYPTAAENSRVQTVLDRLVGARLLVTGSTDVNGDGVEDTVVEPAHDALVAAWDKLLQWKRQAEEFLPLQRRLWQAAGEWKMAPKERQRGLLWDANPRLPQLEETLWPTRSKEDGLTGRTRWARQVLWPQTDLPMNTQWLNQAEVAFVQASVKRRASGLRRVIATTATIIAVLLLLLVFAEGQRRTAVAEAVRANTNETLAQKNEQIARENEDEAIRQAALAETEAENALRAQATAEAERDNAKSRELIFRAQTEIDKKLPMPERALLLGVEALNIHRDQMKLPLVEVEAGVRTILGNVGGIPLQGIEEEMIVDVDFMPNGQELVAISGDGNVYLWDVEQWDNPQTIHRSIDTGLRQVEFSPDGLQLVVGGSSELAIWDTREPNGLPHVLDAGSERSHKAFTFSPDGTHLAVSYSDGLIQFLDSQYLDTPPSGTILRLPSGAASWLKFSQNGDWLYAGLSDRVFLWNMHELSSPPQMLSDNGSHIYKLALSSGDPVLAAGFGNSVKVWRINQPLTETITLPSRQVYELIFSPDGHWLAVGDVDGVVTLWNINNLEAPPITLVGHQGLISSMSFSYDGRWLVVDGGGPESVVTEHIVYQWDMQNLNKEPVRLRGHEGKVYHVEFSPDDDWLVTVDLGTTVGGLGSKVRLWRTSQLFAEPIVLSNIPTDFSGISFDLVFSADGNWMGMSSPEGARLWSLDSLYENPHLLPGNFALAFSPDSTHVATGSDRGTIDIWELRDRPYFRYSLDFGASGKIYDIAFSPNSKLVAASNNNAIGIWDLSKAESSIGPINYYQTGGIWLTFSPDGKWLASSGLDTASPVIHVWNMEQVQDTPKRLTGNTVSFDAGNSWIATGSGDSTIRLWDMSDWQDPPIILYGGGESVTDVEFSPSGGWLAAASNNVISLWNLDQIETPPILLTGHERIIADITFSPDGQQLASASWDTTIRLWSLANPELDPIVFSGHTHAVQTVNFAPNSLYLASYAEDLTVRLWTLPVSPLIDQACRLAGRNFTQTEWNMYFPQIPYRRTCDLWPAHPSVMDE